MIQMESESIILEDQIKCMNDVSECIIECDNGIWNAKANVDHAEIEVECDSFQCLIEVLYDAIKMTKRGESECCSL